MDSHSGNTAAPGDAVFDASQYAFFGSNIGEEIELGGLDDVEEGIPAENFNEEEFLFDRREEADETSSMSEFSNAFMKMNTLGDRVPRESSSTSNRVRNEDSSIFLHPSFDSQYTQDLKRWSSQPYLNFNSDLRPLQRTSSYPDQQQLPQPNHNMNLFPPTIVPFPEPPIPFNGFPRRPPPPMMTQMHLTHHIMPPQLGPFSGMRPHFFPPMPNFRDQRPKLYPNMPPQGLRRNFPIYRSKYMTVDEVENIMRMQLTATHASDPYIDDYYHQAHLAKKFPGHHFCPTHLRDAHPVARVSNDQQAFLQVDALGRVPFSSFRRPRPLLDVESANSIDGNSMFDKPLEQEPLLAVRVTIEDSLLFLLDVDDVDRFLEFNKFQDGGIQLQVRREALLDEVATSLHLVDPLAKSATSPGISPNDDLMFLRITSLSKGRKLLSRFLNLIPPTSDLMRIVCMAIFRHLRFLFGDTTTDPESVGNLALVVARSVRRTDLCTLSACLAAVVCSPEPPPLRPLGSPAGYGASLLMLSVLERASEVTSDPPDAMSFMPLWKASFDEFFDLLMRYCVSKYEYVMRSGVRDPADAIKRELPLELLRASVAHADAGQKKMLFELSQRKITNGENGNTAAPT